MLGLYREISALSLGGMDLAEAVRSIPPRPRAEISRYRPRARLITSFYYTTKLLGGLIQKIHQSDRAIAGLIFSKYQTGSVRIRPEIELFKMADAEEIEVCKLSPRNTKQFLSRRRKTPLWDWFGMWNNLERPEEARWTWKREVITNGSSWASRFYRRT